MIDLALTTPFDPLHNDGYQFWSGIGSDVFLLTGGVVLFKRVNCHERHCWRIGTHKVEGTPYVTCHKHHPGLEGEKVQRGHIALAHRRVKEAHERNRT